jgi:tetratricopeptide (TPR) repeat protein
MLGRVLREVIRQVPWRKNSPANNQALPESWAGEFVKADGLGRQDLLRRLDNWLDSHPSEPAGWALRGDWLARLERFDDAEAAYRRALRSDPNTAQAQQGLGWTLLKVGRLDDAYLHLETAHKLRPLLSDTLVQWGLVSLERGDLADAERKFQRAIDRNGSDAHAWHNMGIVAVQRGDLRRGVERFKRALALEPNLGIAHSNLALALRDMDHLEEGIEAARRAVELKPGNARCLVILGDLLIDAGQFSQAEHSLEDAKQSNPIDPGIRIAEGKLFMATGRLAEAEKVLRGAIDADPSDAEALSGLGQLELLLGRFASGWNLYEHRRRTVGFPNRELGVPEWQGEDLSGKTILLLAEQGLGDQIFFAGCINDLLNSGARVILESEGPLKVLMSRSFPTIEVIDRLDSGHVPGLPTRVHSSDFVLPMGSLPRWFRADVTSFPAHAGYLKADSMEVDALRLRLSEVSSKFKLGIAWRGGLSRTARHQRSINLADLVNAFANEDITLVSLQHGAVEDEIASVNEHAGAGIVHWPALLESQDGAAALTAAVDGVVTVCQTQAHLTGAMGVAGCVLVPAFANWRYGLKGELVPWYPSLLLCRQSALGDWSQALIQASSWVTARREERLS